MIHLSYGMQVVHILQQNGQGLFRFSIILYLKMADCRAKQTQLYPQGYVLSVFWVLLTVVQGHSEVIRSISNFRQPCISKVTGFVGGRTKHQNLCLRVSTVHRVLLSLKTLKLTLRPFQVHFQFSITLYLRNDWSY